jgi:hypothetical protein
MIGNLGVYMFGSDGKMFQEMRDALERTEN